MKRLVLLLCSSLLLAPVAWASGDVKVIALFSGKALLQVGDQQKIVSKGETFEGVLLQSASGRGAKLNCSTTTFSKAERILASKPYTFINPSMLRTPGRSASCTCTRASRNKPLPDMWSS